MSSECYDHAAAVSEFTVTRYDLSRLHCDCCTFDFCQFSKKNLDIRFLVSCPNSLVCGVVNDIVH